MTWEKFGYPLIIAGSIAALVVYFRQRTGIERGIELDQFQGFPGNVVGIDPGSTYGRGDSEIQQYFAPIPSYPLSPGYVGRATALPLAVDPDSADPYQENAPPYVTFNQGSPTTGYGLPLPTAGGDGCGCGGGCASKCASDCQNNTTFVDGNGTCLWSELGVPGAPDWGMSVEAPALDMQYWGY